MPSAANPGNRTYRCSSGEIEVSVQTEEQWHGLAVCLGRPELAYPGSWSVVRTAAPDGPTAQVLEEHFAEEPADLWRERLEAHAVPCAVVDALRTLESLNDDDEVGRHTMTKVTVDGELAEAVQRLTGAPTKKAAVEEAMREYVNMRRREQLIARLGNTDIDLTLEQLKEMRRPRKFDRS